MSSIGPPPLDGDRNHASAIMIPQTTLGAVAFALYCTRLYVRARIVRKLWWDDLLVSLGMVGHWGGSRSSMIKILMNVLAVFPH